MAAGLIKVTRLPIRLLDICRRLFRRRVDLGIGKVGANPFCCKDIVVLRIFPAQNVRCLAKAV